MLRLDGGGARAAYEARGAGRCNRAVNGTATLRPGECSGAALAKRQDASAFLRIRGGTGVYGDQTGTAVARAYSSVALGRMNPIFGCVLSGSVFTTLYVNSMFWILAIRCVGLPLEQMTQSRHVPAGDVFRARLVPGSRLRAVEAPAMAGVARPGRHRGSRNIP